MKKAITVILAIALLAALALPAVADAFTLYVTRSGVRVYAKKSTSSEVYHKLSKGQKVLIEKKSGSWYAILVEDPEGGQMLGWVQAKYLSTTKPSRKKKSSQSTPATVTPSSTKEIERAGLQEMAKPVQDWINDQAECDLAYVAFVLETSAAGVKALLSGMQKMYLEKIQDHMMAVTMPVLRKKGEAE